MNKSLNKPLNNLTYRQNGDYLIPNLMMDTQDTSSIGKYGRMRQVFLLNHRSILYNELVLTGKLYDHLREIDAAAETRLNTIMPGLAKNANITETLKAENTLEWVKQMNAIKVQVEEIIANELLYC